MEMHLNLADGNTIKEKQYIIQFHTRS